MAEDSKDRRSRDDDVAELDRKAWNLPQPLAPVGPEVAPVDEGVRRRSPPRNDLLRPDDARN